MLQIIDLEVIDEDGDNQLELKPGWKAVPFELRGALVSGHYGYTAALYHTPQGVHLGAAVAETNGLQSGGNVTFSFTGSQMDLEMLEEKGLYGNFWLTLKAIQSDAQGTILRAGWIKVKEGGFTSSSSPPAEVVFSVSNEQAQFILSGDTWAFSVVNVASVPGQPDGQVQVVNETLLFIYGEVQWASSVVAVATPPGLDEGEVTVINGNMCILLSGQCWSQPVVQI